MVLVGDPAQLPATILSPDVERAGYGQSLFQRLCLAGHPVQLLDLQYRMHPSICDFASRQFYSGQLQNAPKLTVASRRKPFHRQLAFRPFVFHNVVYGRQRRGDGRDGAGSYENGEEIRYVMQMFKTIHEQLSVVAN